MDKRSFQRLLDGTDIFLIVNDVSLCKIDNVVLELEGAFPLSMHNQLIKDKISGTFITGELDETSYEEKMGSMLVIDKRGADYDYNIVIFRVVITDNNNNVVKRLQGNTEYSYTANAIRILNVEGEKWIKTR